MKSVNSGDRPLYRCIDCCEEKYPINGGDSEKYADCVKLCDSKQDQCKLGIGSTKRDLGPRAPRFPNPDPWWKQLVDWQCKTIR